MQDIGKHSFIPVIAMKILLGIVVIAGITACQATPNTTRSVSSNSTSHIVKVDASLAHSYNH